jgi:hypothetical protein
LAEFGVAELKLGQMQAASIRWQEALDAWLSLRQPLDRIKARYLLAERKIEGGAAEAANVDIAWLEGEAAQENGSAPTSWLPKDARKWLAYQDEMERHYYAAYATAYAAILQGQAGRSDAAAETTAIAERHFNEISRYNEDERLVKVLAAAQAAAGHTVDTLQTAASIKDDYERAIAYAWIAGLWGPEQRTNEWGTLLESALRSAADVKDAAAMAETIALAAAQLTSP